MPATRAPNSGAGILPIMYGRFARRVIQRHASALTAAVLCCVGVCGPALCVATVSAAAAEASNVPVAEDSRPAPRPRIGLVLSGGGARGVAHIGVLKVLEELRVPIDAIAGTSMGAVVGGLYASGLSAREIEAVMTSVNWQDAFRDRPPRSALNFRRKAEDQSFLVRLPVGLNGGRFRLPRGLVQGQKLTQLLRRLTTPVAAINDFDRLPTPFRAVATDLETGAAVVLADGDLVTAMRSSVSAPGVFAPVQSAGRLLVDGGLVDNLPVDVARAMGVDRLIVVDVGFPLRARRELDSVAQISNQMLAILIRRGSDAQRAKVAADDVLIDPPLGDASSFDFSRLAGSVAAGEAAARRSGARLAALAQSAPAYAAWLAQRAAARSGVGRIESLTLTADSRRYEPSLQTLFAPLLGAAPDPAALEQRITALYGRGNLESLDYRFQPLGRAGGFALELDARRNSWGPNYVRFGLNLQDDFAGNSSFNAAARVVLSELTSRGAEWTWDLQLGESPRIATELFVPLDYAGRWFVMPQAGFEVSNAALLQDQQRLAEFRVRRFKYGVDLGRQLENWGEVRVGVRRETGSSRVRLGDPTLPRTDFDVREYFARLAYDRLDDVNFPREGQSASVEWRGERRSLGSTRGADIVDMDALIARSWGRHTGVAWVSAGTHLDENAAPLRSAFPLGGFLNLSGLAPKSISGQHFGIARALYYRKVGSGGEGFLNVPTYVGLSLEIGNVWDSRRDISFQSARRQGSVFLGLDTLLGPVYLGSGFDDEGQSAFYLFLGRTF